ncbi:hypothetical protein HKW97_07885 [Pseudomonas luteola]|uniref:hypothetical protein n=1 Tax=Pseudomonas luteola TaxID=47886 RepID=UPI00388F3421
MGQAKLMLLAAYLFLPLSYFSVFGVRFLFIQVLLVVSSVFISIFYFKRVWLDASFWSGPLIFFLLFGVSFFTKDFSVLMAFSAFIMFAYWQAFFDEIQLNDFVLVLKKAYSVAALISAIGVIGQFLMNDFYKIEIARVEYFGGGRTAYSFLWQDFSFLSLFVVSAIPIVYVCFHKKIRFLVILLLIFSSIATSARTGIVSLTIFSIFIFIFIFLKSVFSGKANSNIGLGFFLILILFFFVPSFLTFFTGRELTFSSSGRFEGFAAGLNFLSNNVVWGAMFDINYFVENIAIIPHNIFLYFMIMGGMVFFVLFLAWFFQICWVVRYADKDLIFALFIVFIGFQFIPSFFSGYFAACLLGLAFSSARTNLSKLGSV